MTTGLIGARIKALREERKLIDGGAAAKLVWDASAGEVVRE